MAEHLKNGFSSFTNAGTNNATPLSNMFAKPASTSNVGALSAFGSGTGNLFGAKPAGSLFGGGANAATTSAPATTTSPFGGFGANASNTVPATNISAAPNATTASSLFNTKPAEQTTNSDVPGTSTPKPAGGLFNNFGGNANTASTTTPAASGFFASPSKPTESTNPTPLAGGPLFGNNLFAKKADTPAASSAPPSSAAPSPFANLGAKKDGEASTDKNNPTPVTPAGGLFGQQTASKDAPTGSAFDLSNQKPAEKNDTPAESEKKDGTVHLYVTTTPTPLLFGSAAAGRPSTTAASGAGTSSSANGISVPAPSMLRGKTIEEIVNKWSSDLETHVREFNRLSGEVAVWDRALIDNGNTIAALFQHTLLAEREQSDIEHSLKHVEDQQKELSSTLEVYERAAGEIFDGQGGGLRALDVGPADAERDKHYTLAADLNANLDDLSRSLMQMIDSVNTLSEYPEDAVGGDSGKAKGDAPLEQIAQILSSHLESLQWIDGAVREVDSKVADVEHRVREASSTGQKGSGTPNSLAGSVNGSNGLSRSRGFGLR